MVRFIDGDFAASAASLGWSDFDLFGCDAIAPYSRIDRMGLLWLITPGRLIALSENTATILFPTKSVQTWHRRPCGFDRLCAWDFSTR
jgi:hypothetical protein